MDKPQKQDYNPREITDRKEVLAMTGFNTTSMNTVKTGCKRSPLEVA